MTTATKLARSPHERSMTPEHFRAWRDRMKMTQSQAAEALGVSLSSIQLYEGTWTPTGGRKGEISKTVRLAMAALEAGISDPG